MICRDCRGICCSKVFHVLVFWPSLIRNCLNMIKYAFVGGKLKRHVIYHILPSNNYLCLKWKCDGWCVYNLVAYSGHPQLSGWALSYLEDTDSSLWDATSMRSSRGARIGMLQSTSPFLSLEKYNMSLLMVPNDKQNGQLAESSITFTHRRCEFI